MDANEIRRQEAERDRLLSVNAYREVPILGTPAKGSITADLKAAQEEIRRLKLQVEELRKQAETDVHVMGEISKARDVAFRQVDEKSRALKQCEDENSKFMKKIVRLKLALEKIYKNEGPGLDGSSENASGKIARLALEE